MLACTALFLVLLAQTASPGCLSFPGTNLTATGSSGEPSRTPGTYPNPDGNAGILPGNDLSSAELADQFLVHAAEISDYRSTYVLRTGLDVEDPALEVKVQFDYQSPAFARMEVLEAEYITPGTFWVSNGTSAYSFDAASRTYQPYTGSDLVGSNDYQFLVRQVVANRNFVIAGRDSGNKTERYLIEAPAGSLSANFTTPFLMPYFRAWIEPSTGLARAVMICDDCVTAIPNFQRDKMTETTDMPEWDVRYESIVVNTGIPESYFDFVPPEESRALPGPYL